MRTLCTECAKVQLCSMGEDTAIFYECMIDEDTGQATIDWEKGTVFKNHPFCLRYEDCLDGTINGHPMKLRREGDEIWIEAPLGGFRLA